MISPRASMIVLAGLLAVQLNTIRAEAQDVTLSTSHPCYAPGDTVSFRLSNRRSSSIFMPNNPVWDVIDASGFQVAPLIHFTVVVELAGESTATYVWLQTGHDASQVSTGVYRVEVVYATQFEPWAPVTLSTPFEVEMDCPPAAMTVEPWSRMKVLYR